ncbi:hypothetical protein SCLCIDRAFT_1216424 [Scleroderma citrinum Foug A]|uniref:Uncharacterized protein n=1 Tax=Scleroderma citrinum Foug A TaxID=1036808 RepID=A0A0C3A7T7_9AGAM|nr:hypothetical protein SCLCIDRAFT_1216424 [Scleroderma citrinum Foug A]
MCPNGTTEHLPEHKPNLYVRITPSRSMSLASKCRFQVMSLFPVDLESIRTLRIAGL